MRTNEVDFLNHLENTSLLDGVAARRARLAMEESQQSLPLVLLELGLLQEDVLVNALADHLRLEPAKATILESEPVEIPGIPLQYVFSHDLFPLNVDETTVTLATANPLDKDYANAVSYFSGLELETLVVSQSALQSRLSKLLNHENSLTELEYDQHATESDAERLRDLASEAPVIKLLSGIVTSALDGGASDIHFEPSDNGMDVRCRKDGILHYEQSLDTKTSLAVISRIKVLARLNIAEKRLPQDGKIRIPVHGRQVDLRVSTSPLVNGEGAVLRILDKTQVALEFSSLGFARDAIDQLKLSLSHKNGIVLVTGPTGSGKTTTLYSALRILNRPENKIFSVEDPVEMQLSGISQIPVRSDIGLDFATILRSVLRQDPDVIMVGEIRDPETARIAVQASLTGHLVLSTVHTNSAAGAITRLRNLGIDDFLLSSCLRVVAAQRLVRKSCVACRGTLGKPCKLCSGTGYVGRTVVYEIMPCSNDVVTAIATGKGEAEIESLALDRGMVRLQQHGKSLVHLRVTTSEELSRLVLDA